MSDLSSRVSALHDLFSCIVLCSNVYKFIFELKEALVQFWLPFCNAREGRDLSRERGVWQQEDQNWTEETLELLRPIEAYWIIEAYWGRKTSN